MAAAPQDAAAAQARAREEFEQLRDIVAPQLADLALPVDALHKPRTLVLLYGNFCKFCMRQDKVDVMKAVKPMVEPFGIAAGTLEITGAAVPEEYRDDEEVATAFHKTKALSTQGVPCFMIISDDGSGRVYRAPIGGTVVPKELAEFAIANCKENELAAEINRKFYAASTSASDARVPATVQGGTDTDSKAALAMPLAAGARLPKGSSVEGRRVAVALPRQAKDDAAAQEAAPPATLLTSQCLPLAPGLGAAVAGKADVKRFACQLVDDDGITRGVSRFQLHPDGTMQLYLVDVFEPGESERRVLLRLLLKEAAHYAYTQATQDMLAAGTLKEVKEVPAPGVAGAPTYLHLALSEDSLLRMPLDMLQEFGMKLMDKAGAVDRALRLENSDVSLALQLDKLLQRDAEVAAEG